MTQYAGTHGAPSLIVLPPSGPGDERIDLTKERLAVGRAPDCDICLNDPHVSRQHAMLWRRGETYFVQDMGSSGGTKVNGVAVVQPCELHGGDVVTFATVQMRYESIGGDASTRVDLTAVPAAQTPPPAPAPAPAGASYDVGDQRAGVINNVGQNQYNIQQRESFLREIARTRTKARALIWIGVAFVAIGFTMFAVNVLGFLSQVSSATENTDPNTLNPMTPTAILGWAMGAVGMFMVLVGIVLHIVATSRRKRVDRELPRT